MRPPQPLLNSLFFQFESVSDLKKSLSDSVSLLEIEEVERLAAMGLPPISSLLSIAAMVGVNPGLIWSFVHRPHRHYRSFFIIKGRKTRRIDAPRVALKIIQKWISIHLERAYVCPRHVFGFVAGRSHVQAAAEHLEAKWVFSSDIKDFFPTTPISKVVDSLQGLGYNAASAALVARLCCLSDVLSQGAPSSPILSNICFSHLDAQLSKLAENYACRFTRYADDIVFSGTEEFPKPLINDIATIFLPSPWQLAEEKTKLAELPHRLKVHGLLVHGKQVRLTKGYRNRIRGFQHLLSRQKISGSDLSRIQGHVGYGEFVARSAPVLNSSDE